MVPNGSGHVTPLFARFNTALPKFDLKNAFEAVVAKSHVVAEGHAAEGRSPRVSLQNKLISKCRKNANFAG